MPMVIMTMSITWPAVRNNGRHNSINISSKQLTVQQASRRYSSMGYFHNAHRLAFVERISKKKGCDGQRMRWFSSFDSTASALRHRHTLLFLADVAVMIQNGNPFVDVGLQFSDSLDDVHKKCGQSLLVLSALLRDDTLFQVAPI